jgi:hypothetical protein
MSKHILLNPGLPIDIDRDIEQKESDSPQQKEQSQHEIGCMKRKDHCKEKQSQQEEQQPTPELSQSPDLVASDPRQETPATQGPIESTTHYQSQTGESGEEKQTENAREIERHNTSSFSAIRVNIFSISTRTVGKFGFRPREKRGTEKEREGKQGIRKRQTPQQIGRLKSGQQASCRSRISPAQELAQTHGRDWDNPVRIRRFDVG